MKRAILIDIGNVLIFFSYEKMLHKVADVCGIDFIIVQQEIGRLGPLYEEGRISTAALWQHFAGIAAKVHTQQEFESAISDIFHPNPSIYPVVEQLKSKGHPLILVSNTNEVHYNFLKKSFPIISQFHYAALSHEVQARKPNRAIYEAAIAAAGCAPEECFYTDDIMDYVNAARSLGIDAELYTDTETYIKHLKLRGLT